MEEYDDDGDCITLTAEDRAQIAEELASYDTELIHLGSNDLATIVELGRRKRHLAEELKAGRRLPIAEYTGRYDTEIIPRAAALGGGWRLFLLDNGLEVGGGVFPVTTDAQSATAWWETLNAEQRRYWQNKLVAADPQRSHLAYLLEEAWFDAVDAAGEWLETRTFHNSE